MNRGGRREGAGAKPEQVARCWLQVRSDLESKARWQLAAELEGVSLSEWIRDLADERAERVLDGKDSGR